MKMDEIYGLLMEGIDPASTEGTRSLYREFQENQSFRFKMVYLLAQDGYVVHGSDKVFYNFNKAKVQGGSRGRYGFGAYFADSAYKCEEYGRNFVFLNITGFNIINLYDKVSSGKVKFPDKVGQYEDLQSQCNQAEAMLDTCRNNAQYDYYTKVIEDTKRQMDGIFRNETEHEMYSKLSKILKENPDIVYGRLNNELLNSFWNDVNEEISDLYLSLGVDGFKADNEYCIFNFDKLNANIVRDREGLLANYV